MNISNIRIGVCPKCGGEVYFDNGMQKCIFTPVNGCTCQCPYPENFMEWWNGYGGADVENDYFIWSAGYVSGKQAKKES